MTSAWSQSFGSLPVLYDCWKMCVMMGAICSAVSLRTLAGSSSGPVALFWLRFFNCLIIPFVPISRGGGAGVQLMIYYRNGVTFAGEYRGKLVVEGICLIECQTVSATDRSQESH